MDGVDDDGEDGIYDDWECDVMEYVGDRFDCMVI